jgi:hypothetical protein
MVTYPAPARRMRSASRAVSQAEAGLSAAIGAGPTSSAFDQHGSPSRTSRRRPETLGLAETRRGQRITRPTGLASANHQEMATRLARLCTHRQFGYLMRCKHEPAS